MFSTRKYLVTLESDHSNKKIKNKNPKRLRACHISNLYYVSVFNRYLAFQSFSVTEILTNIPLLLIIYLLKEYNSQEYNQNRLLASLTVL